MLRHAAETAAHVVVRVVYPNVRQQRAHAGRGFVDFGRKRVADHGRFYEQSANTVRKLINNRWSCGPLTLIGSRCFLRPREKNTLAPQANSHSDNCQVSRTHRLVAEAGVDAVELRLTARPLAPYVDVHFEQLDRQYLLTVSVLPNRVQSWKEPSGVNGQSSGQQTKQRRRLPARRVLLNTGVSGQWQRRRVRLFGAAHDLFALLATVRTLTHDVLAFGALVQVEDLALATRLARTQRERLLLLFSAARNSSKFGAGLLFTPLKQLTKACLTSSLSSTTTRLSVAILLTSVSQSTFLLEIQKPLVTLKATQSKRNRTDGRTLTCLL